MNPFTDQWSDQPPVTSNPTTNYTIPAINQQPVSLANNQYPTDGLSNVPINQTNVQTNQSSTQPDDRKPIASLPTKIFNEIFSNYEMMICKLFYLLFYSAFGSLFPLIGRLDLNEFVILKKKR